MALVTRITGPIDPEAARWAAGLNDPAGGRLALVVPPALPSLAALVGELLGLLGKPAGSNPRTAPAPEVVALGRAWLRAHEIERILLVHADWLTDRVAGELCAFAALVGVELDCVISGSGPDAFTPWSDGEIGWIELVDRVTREQGRRAARAGEPRHHQRDQIPPLGLPADTARVVPGQLDPFGRSAYIDLAGRIRRDGRTEGAVARSLVLVLRTFTGAEPFSSAVLGAAAALEQSGWALLSSRIGGERRAPTVSWTALRTGVHPCASASVALAATGLWPNEIAALRVGDVATDGAWVLRGGRPLMVPAGARLYLSAQRQLGAGPDGPFLHHRGRAFRPVGVPIAASAALAEAGVTVRPERFRRPSSPSARWLAERGLVLRPGNPERVTVRKTPLCSHGLPRELVVDGVALGHSQKLCLGTGSVESRPWEVRPTSGGFTVTERERSDLGARYAVSRSEEPAGEIVGIERADGPVWVQVGAGEAPSLDAIAAVVRQPTG